MPRLLSRAGGDGPISSKHERELESVRTGLRHRPRPCPRRAHPRRRRHPLARVCSPVRHSPSRTSVAGPARTGHSLQPRELENSPGVTSWEDCSLSPREAVVLRRVGTDLAT
jgi:hypothetical protein